MKRKHVPWAAKPVRPLTDEQRELAGRHIRIAWKLSGPLMETFPELRDEFESAAMLAVVTSARDFDPGMGYTFSTFAYRRVRGELAEVSRRAGPKGYRRSASRDGMPSMVRLDFDAVSDDCPVGTEIEDVDSFEALIRPLPANCRHVVRRHHLHGETMASIAAGLAVSPARVSQLYALAIKLLTPIPVPA